MKHIISIAMYFGIGAIAHLFVMGEVINWASPWTYAVVLAWPVLLVLWLFLFAVGVAIVVVIFALMFFLVESVVEARL